MQRVAIFFGEQPDANVGIDRAYRFERASIRSSRPSRC